MGEELFRNIQKDMEVYLDGMLLGVMGSTISNVNTSTLTIEDMERTYNLVNTPREVSFTIENPKIDQFQLAQLMGMKVFEHDLIKEWKQIKTHKKKRINKKWLKRYGRYPIYDDNVYMINGTLIGNRKNINAIKEYYKVN